MVRRTFVIRNRLGLHARAAAQLVQLAADYKSDLVISKDGQEVNGKSIMGLMMLAASQGATIDVEADGPDAEELMKAVEALIEAKFNESA
ncbi:MAG TPA: HPr family phosphocarrier protein [Candidatus Binatia bacterium]|nr:HPr family phosphocarrier protein [Candidatus Binatia bacterium]